MHSLLLAIQFLTRLPLTTELEWSDESVARSVLFYPLVGLLIGMLLWLFATLLDSVPAMLQAALVLVAWVILTGGLHLDGLADSADAWAGAYGDKEKALEIMKDPAAGPVAVVVLVLLLIVKFAALTVLLEQHTGLLIVAPILGRMAILLLLLTTPYVRQQGLGSSMAQYLDHQKSQWVLLISALILILMLPLSVFVIVAIAAALMLYGLRYLMINRIQGMTGDTIGASVEMVECISLVALAMAVAA